MERNLASRLADVGKTLCTLCVAKSRRVAHRDVRKFGIIQVAPDNTLDDGELFVADSNGSIR